MKIAHESPYDPGVDRAADTLDELILGIRSALAELNNEASVTPDGVAALDACALRDRLRSLDKSIVELVSAVGVVGPSSETPPKDLATVMSIAETRELIAHLEASLAREHEWMVAVLRHHYRDFDTDWEHVLRALEWSTNVRAYYGGRSVPDAAAQRIVAGEFDTFDLVAYQQAIGDLEERSPAIGRFFEGSRTREVTTTLLGGTADAKRFLMNSSSGLRISESGTRYGLPAKRSSGSAGRASQTKRLHAGPINGS